MRAPQRSSRPAQIKIFSELENKALGNLWDSHIPIIPDSQNLGVHSPYAVHHPSIVGRGIAFLRGQGRHRAADSIVCLVVGNASPEDSQWVTEEDPASPILFPQEEEP
jgi:hypothetical protein